ncbi:hypothetical protein JCM5353_004523 [Sporobolomyces roseus]
MCQAKATLAYGLTVRAASLYFAVNAWPRIQPVLPFFDLIFLRRRKGSLTSLPENAAVTQVPDEVWEEIRQQLVQEEIADVEHDLLSQLACRNSRCPITPQTGQMRWYRFMEKKTCKICLAEVREWSLLGLGHWAPDFLKTLRGILNEFGLALPVAKPIFDQVKADGQDYTRSLALIAAPSYLRDQSSIDTTIISACCGGDEGPDEHSLVDISFALPHNIDQRFKHFVRYFALEVDSASINKISAVSNTGEPSEKSKSKKGKTRGIKNKVVAGIKPRWKLWTTCESSF